MPHDKKRILFICDNLIRGGAAQITVELANALAERGHQVIFAVLNMHQAAYQLHSSIEWIDLNFRKTFVFEKLWKKKNLNAIEIAHLQALFKTQNYDLVLLGYLNAYYVRPWIPNYANLWHWIHADLLEFRPSQNYLKLIKEFLRQFRHQRLFRQLFQQQKMITVNRDLAEKYHKIEPSCHFRVIANGVKSNIIVPQTPSVPVWDCVFVGRLVAIKQVDHAIQAFAQSGLTGKMAIVGEGNCQKKLEQLVHSLNLTERVIFLGWQECPQHIIAQSKCLILSSYYEGFGLVLAESIILNIPVVSYASSQGIIDMLEPSIRHLALIEKQNIGALALQLRQVVESPYCYPPENQYRISLERMLNQFLQLAEHNVEPPLE